MRALLLLISGLLMVAPEILLAEDLPFLGLAHVGIRVSDLQASRSFYHDALGLEEAFYTQTNGTVLVSFFKVNDHQFIELFPGLKEDEIVPMTHVAIETDNIEKLRQMLTDRGAKVSPIKKGPRDGNLSCSIRELPGQTLKFLEFVQYMPDSLHTKSIGKALGPKRLSSRLEHAGIIVTNYEAARDFYLKLGFRETWSRKTDDGQPMLVHLRLPGQSGDYVELSYKPNTLNRSAAGTAAHCSLMVPDIKAAYQETLNRGLTKNRKEPRFGRDDRWQFNLFDPDGTRVECMQPKATSKPPPAS